MSDKCYKAGCNKSSQKTKKCVACENLFHTSCGEFASYKDKSKPEKTVHLCATCNANPANSASLTLRYNSRSNSVSSKRSRTEDTDTSDDEEPDLKTILKAIKAENVSTNKLVSNLTSTVQTFNSNLNSRCDGLDSKISALQTEMEELKKSHDAEMDSFKEKYDELEFRTKTEIFIHGHAHANAPEIDLTAIVIHLAEHLDVNVSERDIQGARVIKRRENPGTYAAAAKERQPIIAVDFYTHEMALRLVEKKKSYGKLTNKDLLKINDASYISVSFPLNKVQYAILREAKSRAARHNIKYVWNSRGFVFIRQTDGSRAIKVRNAAHLDCLLPPEDATSYQPMDTTAPQ